MSEFPIILIPSNIEQVKSRLPTLPPSPLVPSPPGREPEKVNTSVIAVESVSVTIPSVTLAAQEGYLIPAALFFLASLAAIAAQTWRQITTYPKRKKQHQQKFINYTKELKDYQKKKLKHEEEIKIKIADFQYKLLLEILTQTQAHDGINSKARRGWSEQKFLAKLAEYFPKMIYAGLTLNIPNYQYPYTPDFVYIDKEINLYIDIEIDEPYAHNNRQATHYLGSPKDRRRNEFFLEKNWIIIRFSEEQVVTAPESCCKTIAEIIFNLTGNSSILNDFIHVPDIQRTKQWTELEAIISHGIIKEKQVPTYEIEQAIKNKTKFEQNPELHTYSQELI